MKTIKLLQIASVITVLVLIGCSDHLISPEFTESTGSGTANSAVNRLNTEIDLKPFSSYTFNSSNTDFAKINSIRAEIMTAKLPALLECQGLLVYSSSSDKDLSFDCNSSGFNVSDITVENTGDLVIRVSVILTGELKKIKEVK